MKVLIAMMENNYIIWSFPNTIFTMKFIHELSIRFLVLTKYIL
jgi:hypothetical protein